MWMPAVAPPEQDWRQVFCLRVPQTAPQTDPDFNVPSGKLEGQLGSLFQASLG